MIRNIILLTLIILLAGCSHKKGQESKMVVARAGDRTLYYDHIPDIIQPGMSKADSTSAIQNYIHRWSRKELLCVKAEENLTDEYKNEVARQLDEMRDNLLIYQYQQQMIIQKMDTTVSDSELQEYYVSNMSTFTLTSNIIKVLFIKVPVNAPDIQTVRKLYNASGSEDLRKLEKYCHQYAVQYDDFNEQWISFAQLLMLVPLECEDQEAWLTSNDDVELKDSNFYYFISIRDYKLRRTVAPYEYITDQVKTIILNNRRNDFLQKLEDGIYNEAVRNNTLKVY